MNKGELVALMSELSHSKNDGSKGYSKVDAEKALALVLDTIVEALSRGEDIHLVGIGSFQIQHRAARDGRNPKTGEKMHIAAYNQPVFKAGKKMKEACNG